MGMDPHTDPPLLPLDQHSTAAEALFHNGPTVDKGCCMRAERLQGQVVLGFFLKALVV